MTNTSGNKSVIVRFAECVREPLLLVVWLVIVFLAADFIFSILLKSMILILGVILVNIFFDLYGYTVDKIITVFLALKVIFVGWWEERNDY